jgi:hypothetical protein
MPPLTVMSIRWCCAPACRRASSVQSHMDDFLAHREPAESEKTDRLW